MTEHNTRTYYRGHSLEWGMRNAQESGLILKMMDETGTHFVSAQGDREKIVATLTQDTVTREYVLRVSEDYVQSMLRKGW